MASVSSRVYTTSYQNDAGRLLLLPLSSVDYTSPLVLTQRRFHRF